MIPQEAKEALDSLVDKGFMVRNKDDTYSPTPLGRLVAEGSGCKKCVVCHKCQGAVLLPEKEK